VDYPETDKGKCGTCGFLSKQSRGGFGSPSPTYFEITVEERRNTPLFFTRWELSGRSISTDLACFRGIADLQSEYSREVDEGERKTKATLVLKRDRKCEGWYPYKTGFDPMEHFLWYQEQEREKDRRAFEERLSQRAEELHKSLALRDEELQTQRDQAATSTNKLMARLTMLALIFAAAQVLTLTRDSLIAKAAVWAWHLLRSLL
jgi:hypothetical protein